MEVFVTKTFFVCGMCLKMTEIFSLKGWMAQIFSSKMAELFSLKTLEIVVTGVVTLMSEVVLCEYDNGSII